MASRIFARRLIQCNRILPSLIQRSTLIQRCTPAIQKKCFHQTPISSAPPASKEAISFNVQDEEDFKERVIKSPVPVVVDFHANWCGPCKILGPRLETLVAGHKGDVLLAKVDIDDLGDLAVEYNVSAVPTVVAIKKGKETDRFLGVLDDDQLDSFLAKLKM